jgi:hypothetical protein
VGKKRDEEEERVKEIEGGGLRGERLLVRPIARSTREEEIDSARLRGKLGDDRGKRRGNSPTFVSQFLSLSLQFQRTDLSLCSECFPTPYLAWMILRLARLSP